MIRTAVKRPGDKNEAANLITYVEEVVEETPVEETTETVVEEAPVEEVKEETVEEKEEAPAEETTEE
jgi:hypothetical protein